MVGIRGYSYVYGLDARAYMLAFKAWGLGVKVSVC